MIKWLLAVVTVSVLTVAAFYAWLYRPQREALDAARRDASLCAQESSALRSRADDLQDMLDEAKRDSAELAARVREREEQLKAVTATQDELVTELQDEIAQGQVQIERLRNNLRLEMVNEILFDSGEAELKTEGREILKKVAPVLERSGRPIEVQGHTDNVPIRGALAERYATNWELSAARAINVVRYLHEQAGLDPGILSAKALSEFAPRATNDTEEGRQRNRRIEILLAPPVETGRGGEEATAPAAAGSQESTPPAEPPN